VAAVGVTLIHRGYLPVQIKTVSSTVAEETKTIQVVESRMETEAQSIEAKNGDTEEATAAASGTVYKHYTVRRGDTLANISLSLYDSRDYVDTICEINDIEDPDVIYEGMVLELP
jgi:nucleoid-associated protein YgaU